MRHRIYASNCHIDPHPNRFNTLLTWVIINTNSPVPLNSFVAIWERIQSWLKVFSENPRRNKKKLSHFIHYGELPEKGCFRGLGIFGQTIGPAYRLDLFIKQMQINGITDSEIDTFFIPEEPKSRYSRFTRFFYPSPFAEFKGIFNKTDFKKQCNQRMGRLDHTCRVFHNGGSQKMLEHSQSGIHQMLPYEISEAIVDFSCGSNRNDEIPDPHYRKDIAFFRAG